jgi:hypothetical protein
LPQAGRRARQKRRRTERGRAHLRDVEGDPSGAPWLPSLDIGIWLGYSNRGAGQSKRRDRKADRGKGLQPPRADDAREEPQAEDARKEKAYEAEKGIAEQGGAHPGLKDDR